jgi:hypothetical protein
MKAKAAVAQLATTTVKVDVLIANLQNNFV